MNKNSLTHKILGPELLSTGKAKVYAQDMTRLVDIKDAGSSFTALADEVLAGQEVVFSQEGKPVLKLVLLESDSSDHTTTDRKLGFAADLLTDFSWDEWHASHDEFRKLFRDYEDFK